MKSDLISFFYHQKCNGNGIWMQAPQNPSVDDIPPDLYALWLNTETGELFVFLGLRDGGAVWKGQMGTVVVPSTVAKFDVFEDGSATALWQFDGSALDAGGNYNGIWNGNEQYDIGVFGQAAKFDGNSYVSFPDGIETCFQGNKEFTITGWFKYDSFSQKYSRVFDFKAHLLMSHEDTSGTLIVDFRPNAYSGDFSAIKRAFASIEVGTFYFFAISWNGFELKLSLKDTRGNDIPISYDSLSLGGPNSPVNAFGKSSWSWDDLFVGEIDQVRIFNRALKEEEILMIYNETE